MSQERQRPDKIELPDMPLDKRRRGSFARVPRQPLHALKSDNATVVRLYGVIGGDGITAGEFAETINGIQGDITLRVHSPGGDPLAAVSMYNDLLAHPGHIRAEVSGLAASAATIILMAADEIAVAPNATVMIHRVSSLVIGDARDHRAEASILDTIDNALIETYQRRTGLTASKLNEMLDAETWLLGNEAIRIGFADKPLEAKESSPLNSYDLSVFHNPPATLTANISSRVKITSAVDLERRLRDQLGLSHGAARLVAAGGYAALTKDSTAQPLTELAGRVAAATAELDMRHK